MTGATGLRMSFFNFFILFVYCVYAKLVLWFYFVKYTTPKKSNFVFYSFWHIDCYLQWMLWENFIHILQYKCLHFITHYHWKLYLCLAVNGFCRVNNEWVHLFLLQFHSVWSSCEQASLVVHRAVCTFVLFFPICVFKEVFQVSTCCEYHWPVQHFQVQKAPLFVAT